MLQRHQKLAIYMEGALTQDAGKMGFGVLRYSPNPVVCVIDSEHAGLQVQEVISTPRQCPIVGTVQEAASLGAEALVLGIAPPGGQIPAGWFAVIDESVELGLSVVNGLHDRLAPRYGHLQPDQWVWDIRVEPSGLGVNEGRAKDLKARRVLMAGTDMASGKMTAGLELWKAARAQGVKAEFVATGQIGITIVGSGVPLDAVRVDFAAGAVEREMLRYPDAELIIVEGQGSLIHPGSSASLPLLRGAMPTHLVLSHRAGTATLRRVPWVRVPPLADYLRLFTDVAEALGTFPRPKSSGICLNTSAMDDCEARAEIARVQAETGLPTTDAVRYGVEDVLASILGK